MSLIVLKLKMMSEKTVTVPNTEKCFEIGRSQAHVIEADFRCYLMNLFIVIEIGKRCKRQQKKNISNYSFFGLSALPVTFIIIAFPVTGKWFNILSANEKISCDCYFRIRKTERKQTKGDFIRKHSKRKSMKRLTVRKKRAYVVKKIPTGYVRILSPIVKWFIAQPPCHSESTPKKVQAEKRKKIQSTVVFPASPQNGFRVIVSFALFN